MISLISGSKVPLLMRCVGSAALGGVYLDEPNVDSARGKALHAFLQAISQAGELTELKYNELLLSVPPEYRDDARVMDVLKLPCANPQSYAAEVALAWNWVTREGRALDTSGSRTYADCDPQEEIVGTIDALGLAGDAVVVLDYKTGRRYLGRPGLSDQLRTYAVMAAAVFRKTKAVIGFIRIDDEGRAWWMTEEISAEQLAEYAERLVAMMLNVAEARATPVHQLDLHDGEHCDSCPSKRRCPALLAMASALAADPASVIPMGGIELSVEQCGQVVMKLAAMKTVMDLAESSLREAARVLGPFPLGDGRFKGLQPVTMRSITNVDLAVDTVAKRVGPERAAKMVERSVSMEAVEGAARSYLIDTTGKNRGLGKFTEEIEADLEKAGALTKRSVQQFKIFTPKKQLPPAAPEEK